jgi:hypothetical protein
LPAFHFTQTSETAAIMRRFSGHCCFQVIYFVSDIFFAPSTGSGSEGPRGNHLVNAHG